MTLIVTPRQFHHMHPSFPQKIFGQWRLMAVDCAETLLLQLPRSHQKSSLDNSSKQAPIITYLDLNLLESLKK